MGVKLQRRNRIPELRRELRPRMERVLNAGATQVAAIARQLCPVGEQFFTDFEGDDHPEALRNSIAVETYAGNSGMAKRVVVGKYYGPFVEFGTVNSAAQPFLMPAWESVKPNLLREMEKIAKL